MCHRGIHRQIISFLDFPRSFPEAPPNRQSCHLCCLQGSQTRRELPLYLPGSVVAKESASPRESEGLNTYGPPTQARQVGPRLCFRPQKHQVQSAWQGRTALEA